MLIPKAKRCSISLNRNVILLLAFIHSFIHSRLVSVHCHLPTCLISQEGRDQRIHHITAVLHMVFFYLLQKLILKHSAKRLSEVKINHPLNLCYSHCVGKLWEEATVPARLALKEHRTAPSAHWLPRLSEHPSNHLFQSRDGQATT